MSDLTVIRPMFSRDTKVTVDSNGTEVWLEISSGQSLTASPFTIEEAIRLSRALVKAAAYAMEVSIQEKAATLPDGPL